MRGWTACCPHSRSEDCFSFADIVVAALHQLNGGAGTQIAAANADNHKHIGVFPDALSSGANAADFVCFFTDRQIQPAQKVIAFAGALSQCAVGFKNLFLRSQQIRQGQPTPNIGNINFNHKVFSSFHRFYNFSHICYRKIHINASGKDKLSVKSGKFGIYYGK